MAILFNEVAAGEVASHRGERIRDAKDRALSALRDGRFADFDRAMDEAYGAGCTVDLEAWACNIVSAELMEDRPA